MIFVQNKPQHFYFLSQESFTKNIQVSDIFHTLKVESIFNGL